MFRECSVELSARGVRPATEMGFSAMRSQLPLIISVSAFLAACGGTEEPVANESTGNNDTEVAEDADTGETSEARVVAAPAGSRSAEPMVIGAADAPLTIIEYASVTCPGCASFHNQILPEIKEKYIETGKVRFEYREFPTAPANLAYAGFYLARCAATQNGAPAYFAMLDALYERQREWAFGPTPGETLENIAAQAGIDREGLEQCFYREDIKAAVKANVVEGMETHNVRGTPTLIVDDEELQWTRSIEGLTEAIERELAERS